MSRVLNNNLFVIYQQALKSMLELTGFGAPWFPETVVAVISSKW